MSPETLGAPGRINTFNEKPLHAGVKAWYTRPGDLQETAIGGYVIDIVRGDLLVEIQTGGFAAIRRKLYALLAGHRVRLVHPVAVDRWIVRQDANGRVLGRRKSPRHGSVVDVFDALVSFPELVAHPAFSLEVLLSQEEEVRRRDPSRRRKRGWVTCERRLLGVTSSRLISSPEDLAALLPSGLAEPFTTAALALSMARPRRLAQRMAYCLRGCGVIELVGKQGNSLLYARGVD